MKQHLEATLLHTAAPRGDSTAPCPMPALPGHRQAHSPCLEVSHSPFKSNHHLREGFCEGKKNSIITMVIPVTASEINLSKSSRNTCKKHKPVELQSLWEQGFTKEDYKFPSGLNNACCSEFFSFLIPCRANFLPWVVSPPEKLPYKSKNQDLIPSTLMFWFSDCRVIRTSFLSLLQGGRETEPKPSYLHEPFAKCSNSWVKGRLHPVKLLTDEEKVHNYFAILRKYLSTYDFIWKNPPNYEGFFFFKK